MSLFIQGLPCGSLSSFIFTLFTVDPKIGVHGQIPMFVQPFGRASASSPPRGRRFHRPDLTALQYQPAHCILLTKRKLNESLIKSHSTRLHLWLTSRYHAQPQPSLTFPGA